MKDTQEFFVLSLQLPESLKLSEHTHLTTLGVWVTVNFLAVYQQTVTNDSEPVYTCEIVFLKAYSSSLQLSQKMHILHFDTLPDCPTKGCALTHNLLTGPVRTHFTPLVGTIIFFFFFTALTIHFILH